MAVLTAMNLSAQTESDFKAQYDRQVKAMGISGPGVEYILKKWEKAFPESPDVQEAGFNYYYDKSRTEEVVGKLQARFLGSEPIFTLTDSTGVKLNYFREAFFDDVLFGRCIQYIEKAIELCPDELALEWLFIATSQYEPRLLRNTVSEGYNLLIFSETMRNDS